MLTASKELGIIKRKRKKSFKTFDSNIEKEETKDKSMRFKHNDDSSNQRITDWLIEKKPKRKDKDTDVSGDREQKNESGDNMNIDIESSKINNPFTKR